jgi:hypothetical protein
MLYWRTQSCGGSVSVLYGRAQSCGGSVSMRYRHAQSCGGSVSMLTGLWTAETRGGAFGPGVFTIAFHFSAVRPSRRTKTPGSVATWLMTCPDAPHGERGRPVGSAGRDRIGETERCVARVPEIVRRCIDPDSGPREMPSRSSDCAGGMPLCNEGLEPRTGSRHRCGWDGTVQPCRSLARTRLAGGAAQSSTPQASTQVGCTARIPSCDGMSGQAPLPSRRTQAGRHRRRPTPHSPPRPAENVLPPLQPGAT